MQVHHGLSPALLSSYDSLNGLIGYFTRDFLYFKINFSLVFFVLTVNTGLKQNLKNI
jgi:hypothetical protein